MGTPSVDRDLPRAPTRRNRVAPASRADVLVIAALWASIALVVAVAAAGGVRMTRLTKDTLQFFESDLFYVGLLSDAGGLAWCAGAATCVFAAAHPRARGAETRAFVAGLGALTAALMADDVFLLHDLVGPVWLGVHELAFYAVYMLAAAALLLRHRRVILTQTPWAVLVLAGGLLAVSETLDLVQIGNIGTDVEDGFKLAGIVAWVRYCWSTAAAVLS